MTLPTLDREKDLFSQGCQCVVGMDEVGRGAWAGPIIAAAFIVTPDNMINAKKIHVRDSKLLSPKHRENVFHTLQKNFHYTLGIVDSSIIDRQGITYANQLAMDRALEALEIQPDFILIDGRGFHFKKKHENVIDGDAKIFCIAAASIMAKVIRDKIMDEWHEIYRGYGFHSHKGYGTKKHLEMLKKYGVCSIHRRSYAPIRELLSQ